MLHILVACPRTGSNIYQTKEIVLLKYYHIMKTIIDNFECFKIYYISRESNTRADLLSKMANTKKVGHLKTIIQEMLPTPTIDAEEIMVGEEGKQNWMTPYKNIIIWRVLPPNKDEARRLKRKASYYSNA